MTQHPRATSPHAPKLGDRSSGILLHPTSLPGPHGSGDLGAEATAFLEFLADAKQRWWQMLPVVTPGLGYSPYSASSAFAGNPMLIDLDGLRDQGLLQQADLVTPTGLSQDRVDFAASGAHRDRALRIAFRAFDASTSSDHAFDRFLTESAGWVEDYALWCALTRAHGNKPWTSWPEALRRRNHAALGTARSELADDVRYEQFVQYVFASQWKAFQARAHALGIGLIGDIPIFVAHDSADVWHERDVFRLDEDGHPTVVSGVPPDYFSATGQRWGNPLYRWKHLKKTGYPWWVERFRTTLARFDAIRLDHFIGFARYWEVPAGEATAENGRWMRGPGAPFFQAVASALGSLPMIAEDLGAVTPAVFALRDQFALRGTKILQYAFGADPNAHDFQPHSFDRRTAVYTGTHDNDTTVGWFHDEGGDTSTRTAEQITTERANVQRYLGSDGAEIHWDMIRLAMASVADTALFPLQDVLGLGSDARMNRPGTADGNWAWRFRAALLTPAVAARLGDLSETYGRSLVPVALNR